MNTIKTYLLIGVLSFLLSPTQVFAQNLDANRMNRDIKIMENILGELFKIQPASSTTNEGVVINSYFSPNNTIKGTYLPGFGIIFKVAGSKPVQIMVNNKNSENSAYIFYYDSKDSSEEDREIDVASVTERVTDFLKNYGSTIGQLKNDEKVMVIYGVNDKSTRFPGLSLAYAQKTDDDKETKELPVISVSSKVSDLKQYRTGKINAAKFEERLAVATSKDKEYLDLKVMSNIFETALKEQEGEAFRLSGGINYLMLDNFGALYSFDVRFSNGQRGGNIWSAYDVRTPRMHNQGSNVVVTGSVGQSTTVGKEKEEFNETIEEAYSKLVMNIKEYVIDYGRTINSVSNDQHILLSVTINGRYETVPERIDIQVKKSVLDQVDKGSISREQAIQKVLVTEY